MKPPYAIGSVPSLSGHANAYRWRSLPRVRRHRASKPQGSSERVLPWQITMDQLIFASLSHTHYWYEVGMLKVPDDNGAGHIWGTTVRNKEELKTLWESIVWGITRGGCETYLVTLTDRCSFLCVSGQRGTIAKSMYEVHLCVVALTSIERGTQFFPLVSYFLV